MADEATIANQDLGATSTTSKHEAKTEGATDICWNPSVTVQVPHTNEVGTDKATEHTTDKTKFGGGNVVRVGDAIGPPSGPPHPDNGAGGGIDSKTHLEKAEVTDGSGNVQTEGKPLARDTDPTDQNSANTKGKIVGADPVAEAKRLAEEKKKACTLDTVPVPPLLSPTYAMCGDDRRCGPDNVLEVVTADTVKLIAKRKNAKEASKKPECEPGDHTKWIVSKWKTGKKLDEKTLIGDEQTLGEEWFSWSGFPGFASTESETKSKVDRKAIKKMNYNQLDADYKRRRAAGDTTPDAPGKSGSRIKRRDTYGDMLDAQGKRRAAGIEEVQAIAKLGISLVQFIRVWNAYDDPVVVMAQAQACSGAASFTFRSVPGTIAEFRIEKDTLEKIRAAVAVLERFCKIFNKLASLAGLPASFGLKVCHLPDVEFEVEWKEMDKDVDAIKKYKHHVDRQWEVTFEFAKLIEWKGGFGIPIALFANLFIPGAGSALNSVLNYIGLEATVGVDIEFALMPAVWFGRDAGETSIQLGGGVKVALVVFFRLKITWRSWLEVAGGVILDFDIKGDAIAPGLDMWQVGLKWKGDVKVGLRGFYRVDVLWWEKSDRFDYIPDQCKLSIPEFTTKVLALLKG